MDTTRGAGALQQHTRWMAKPALMRLWDVDLAGYEQLPTDGPAILCPNHISFFDSALLALTAPRNVSFVGKAEYMDSWKTRYLFPAMGMIPIDRSGGTRSAPALDTARKVLEGGGLFVIFPEGSRSRDGRLHRGRTGAARLATSVGCPIYPVGITGTDRIQPPGASLPEVGLPCSVRIGAPISPPCTRGRAEHVAWRSMTDHVMSEIRKMTGREYVDFYAGDERVASVSDIASTATPEPALAASLG